MPWTEITREGSYIRIKPTSVTKFRLASRQRDASQGCNDKGAAMVQQKGIAQTHETYSDKCNV